MTPTQHRPGRALTLTWGAIQILASAYLGVLSSLAVWAVLPFLMGWVPTVVLSGSMEPLIMTGDIIAAQKVTSADIEAGAVKKGQVLLAENPMKPGSLVTHRVVSIRPDGRFITKGDANIGLDPVPTPAEKVIGIERYRVPYLGIPVVAIQQGNPLPLLAFIAVSTAAVMTLQKDRKKLTALIT